MVQHEETVKRLRKTDYPPPAKIIQKLKDTNNIERHPPSTLRFNLSPPEQQAALHTATIEGHLEKVKLVEVHENADRFLVGVHPVFYASLMQRGPSPERVKYITAGARC